jgi:hypothetical protein
MIRCVSSTTNETDFLAEKGYSILPIRLSAPQVSSSGAVAYSSYLVATTSSSKYNAATTVLQNKQLLWQ